jgi:hypothetical protein
MNHRPIYDYEGTSNLLTAAMCPLLVILTPFILILLFLLSMLCNQPPASPAKGFFKSRLE